MPELVDINTVLGYETEEAAGTGMVLTPTGKVLTNNHVIEGATKISVTDLGNGRTYSARVLGYTRANDIAVLQLEGASGLKTVHIGNSASVKVGEAIVGIGNAGGTGGVPSAAGGSVTALSQSITASDQGSLGTTYEHLTGLIESNADIQPGDSGGPLVTTSGAVVGMDTAASAAQGYSFRGAVTGRGYSIPINEVMSTARQIMARRASTSVHIGGTAFLGIYAVAPQTRFSRFRFGSTGTFTPRTPTVTAKPRLPTRGAAVEQVIPNTPAQAAGLAATDVITRVGGALITSPSDLTNVLLRYHPGDSVKLSWTTSSGGAVTGTVRLASGPPE
jgi:S1-C subfamily serine protease